MKEYGEASVLEKYSCSLAMDLVSKHAIFRNISRSDLAMLPERRPATEASMREAMIKAILATDMSFHYDMLNGLNSLVEATSSPATSPNASDMEDSSDEDEDSESDTELDTTRHQDRRGAALVNGEGKDASNGLDSLVPEIPLQLSIQLTRPEDDTTTGVKAPTRRKTVMMASPVSSNMPDVDATGPDCNHNNRQRSWSTGSLDSEGSSVYYSVASHFTDRYAPAALNVEQRQQLCNCLLHGADISNAVKPWTICKRWSDLVVQEFFRQGDIEKAQGLPVSPNMDRDQHNQPQISLGFGDFVVQPYFEVLTELLPRAIPVLDSLSSNREQWLALQKTSQQFGSDPYLVVDPLDDDPNQEGRPGLPLVPLMSTGRRVSGMSLRDSLPFSMQSILVHLLTILTFEKIIVAAGVLILDDSQPLRTPHRRLRHSTNTEVSHHGGNHKLHKMKRSFSNRSLSASLHNLHIGTGPSTLSAIPRSSLSSARLSQEQDLFSPSGLRRQASLVGKESNTSLDDLLPPVRSPLKAVPRSPSQTTPSPLQPEPQPLPPKEKDQEAEKEKTTENETVGPLVDKSAKSTKEPEALIAGNAVSRQKRLASLPLTGSNTRGTRSVSNADGNDGQAQSLNAQGLTTTSSSATSKSSPPSGHGTGTGSGASNRVSTPAVMMSKIKYDWAISPLLPENPVRLGFGPLDDMTVSSDAALQTSEAAEESNPMTTSISTEKENKDEPSLGSPATSTCTSSVQSFPASPSSALVDGAVTISTASGTGVLDI